MYPDSSSVAGGNVTVFDPKYCCSDGSYVIWHDPKNEFVPVIVVGIGLYGVVVGASGSYGQHGGHMYPDATGNVTMCVDPQARTLIDWERAAWRSGGVSSDVTV